MYAVERSAKRCETLRKIVEGAGAGSVVQVMNRDFLDLDPSEYADVGYIVLDPSCSGSGKLSHFTLDFTDPSCTVCSPCVSGMVNREGESDMSAQRLQSLAAVQARLLRHALSFPNVKKVVYSTCSTSPEENEEVIGAVLSDEATFEAEMCLPSWSRRGLDTHEKGRCFLRADPELDLCNGFFVAVLKRKSGGQKKRRTDGKDKGDGDSCKKSQRRKKRKREAEKT